MSITYYCANEFLDFELFFLSMEHTKKNYNKNDIIAGLSKPVDKIYYITSGVVAASYYHKSGKIRTFTFMGKGNQFPYYFPGEDKVFQSLCFVAVSDVKLIAIRKEKFQQYILNNSEFCLRQFKGYIGLCSFFIEDGIKQAFSGGLERICSFFYIYVTSCTEEELIINLKQSEIMEFVGLNRTNLSKYLKILSDENIIKIGRGKIIILDLDKLEGYITLN